MSRRRQVNRPNDSVDSSCPGGGGDMWRKVGQRLEMCLYCSKAIDWFIFVVLAVTIPDHAYSSVSFS